MVRSAAFPRAVCAAPLGLLAAGRAEAHAFTAGADGYARLLEGAGVILGYPGTLLPLLSLGLLLGLWQADGMLRAWPVLIAGLLVGVPFALIAPPAATLVLMALGMVTAGLAALLSRHWREEAMALAGLTGLLVTAAALEGHAFMEVPLLTQAGVLLMANLVPLCTAGLCRVATEQVPAPWMRILLRVAASWLAAVLILLLALELRPA